MKNLNNRFIGAHPFRGNKEKNSAPKKRNSTPNKINEQIVSIPLLFSPPRVDSAQINRRKNTIEEVHDNSVEKKREDDDFFQTENDPLENKEESSSDFEDLPAYQDEDSFISEESSSLMEVSSSKQEDIVELPAKQEEAISQKKHRPIVKLPILIAKLNIDIDIFETIDLLLPLENVIKIEWSLQSLDCSVISPSTTVFLKGVLIAEVEYSNKGKTNTLHIVRLPIYWSKTIDINWLTLPKLPTSSHNEFMFQSPIDKEASSHFEFHQEFAEKIDNNLRNINFVWHQDLCSQLEIQKLHIVGIAQLSIDLLQSQYVELPLIDYF